MRKQQLFQALAFMTGSIIVTSGAATMYYSVYNYNQTLFLIGMALIGLGSAATIFLYDLVEKLTTKKEVKKSSDDTEKSYVTWYADRAAAQLIIYGVAEIPCKTLLTVRSKYNVKYNRYFYTITSDYKLLEHGDAENTNEVINILKKYI